MADMTQTQLQGYFTSNGKSTTIVLPSGVDWLQIVNQTASANAALGAAAPVQWYWQAGMPAGAGISYWKTSVAADSVNLQQYTTTNGFTFINGYGPQFSVAASITSSTNAVQPVYTVASTAAFSTGSVLRIYGTTQMSVNGYDVQVTVINGTTFESSASWTANPNTGLPASTGGNYQIVNPLDPWYPASRTIINITQATSAVVTTSVQHNYTIGQEISFRLPDATFGMTQIDGMVGTITAATQFTFTVNINTSSFNAFAWPSYTGAATYPQSLPIGENTAIALAQVPPLSPFADATLNTAYYGLQFPGGASAAAAGPAGINNDVIYWRAGVSFLNDTTGALIIH